MKKNTLILALLFSILMINEITSAQKPLYTAPLGVQTYTFRRSIGNDPAKVLDTIKMLGFTEVEGGGGRIAPEDFNKAGKFLKDNGLILCYHAHGYEFQPYEDGTLLDYIFKNTNPEYVSFEMDIFWIQFGGGDLSLI